MPTNWKLNLVKRFEQFLEYAIDENPDAILVLMDAVHDYPVDPDARSLADRV